MQNKNSGMSVSSWKLPTAESSVQCLLKKECADKAVQAGFGDSIQITSRRTNNDSNRNPMTSSRNELSANSSPPSSTRVKKTEVPVRRPDRNPTVEASPRKVEATAEQRSGEIRVPNPGISDSEESLECEIAGRPENQEIHTRDHSNSEQDLVESGRTDELHDDLCGGEGRRGARMSGDLCPARQTDRNTVNESPLLFTIPESCSEFLQCESPVVGEIPAQALENSSGKEIGSYDGIFNQKEAPMEEEDTGESSPLPRNEDVPLSDPVTRELDPKSTTGSGLDVSGGEGATTIRSTAAGCSNKKLQLKALSACQHCIALQTGPCPCFESVSSFNLCSCTTPTIFYSTPSST